jgi:hypothetical protein
MLRFDFNGKDYSINLVVRGSWLHATDKITDANLEKAWLGGSTVSQHSPLTIRHETLNDGIWWIVSGRLVTYGDMKTRSIAAYDNEGDGQIDGVIEATGDGKVDYGILENIVRSTRTYPIEVNWS